MLIFLAIEDPEILGLFSDILKVEKHKVLEASSFQDALSPENLAQAPVCDVAVVDADLGSGRGVEIALELKRAGFAGQLVCLSFHGASEEWRALTPEFVSKRVPFYIRVLLNAVAVAQ